MILVGGENLIDFVQDESANGLPRYVANPGGSPYNVAMAVGRQDVPVGYLTPISSDSLGDLMAARLVESGVTLLGPRAAQPSSLAVVSLTAGVASYGFYREDTAERQVTQSILTAPAGAKAFHIGSLALTGGEDAALWEAFWEESRAAGRFTSLDPNVRAAFIKDKDAYLARITRMAAGADLLKLSDEDLEYLYPDLNQAEGLAKLHRLNPSALTVLTKGEGGAEAWLNDLSVTAPARRAEPFADTVGAGDTFAGTLLAELHGLGRMEAGRTCDLDRNTLQTLLDTAARAAAINCTRSGCNPPTRTELHPAAAD